MLKKTIVFKKKNITLPKFQYKTIVLFTLFFCGAVIGCITITKGDESFLKMPEALLKSYLTAKSDIGFLKDFCNLLVIFLSFPLLVFLLGFCAVGTALIYFAPCFFGVFSGAAAALIMKCYGSAGTGFAALAIIPGTALAAASLVKCCTVASGMSLNLISLLSGNTKVEDGKLINRYLKEYAVQIIPSLLAAIVNAGSFKLFGGLFDFI